MVDLSSKEKNIVQSFIANTKIPKRKSKRKLAIGIVGLVGAGKTSVAKVLGRELGAAVIQADAIRLALRKKRTGFDNVHEIMFAIAKDILKRGGNVILDSDFASKHKQNGLRKIAKDAKATAYFVRVYTDVDTMIGRALIEKHGTKATDLFTGAKTTWRGAHKPAVVKLREMWRRVPHHYTWSKDEGGQWIKKTIGGVYAEIDTTEKTTWRREASSLTKSLSR